MLEHARLLIAAFGIALLSAIALTSAPAQAGIPFLQSPSSQTRYAAIVVDAQSGEVLYAKRADSQRYPASITKVMTLYLTFEALSNGSLRLDDSVVISPRAAAQGPTKLGLPVGDSLTVSEAMQALAIKSANDVAVALAERLGGSETRFATLMTLRAQDLGMTNTHFVNASGLPDSRQVSTARDIAILSRAVMRDFPQYYGLFSQESFTFRGVTMNNHNGLLGRMPGVDGLKTGFTNASGYNLAVSAVRDDRRLIAVVLGGPSNAARDRNAQDLLLTGFDIMSRRARGEVITVAQNMFEPEPAPLVMRASVEQGDRDQALPKAVFTSAPLPPKASRIAIVDPKTTKLRSGRSSDGPWVVQVGAFKTKSEARTQLAMIERRFQEPFADAQQRIAAPVGGSWRAQFKGFSEGAARQACSTLKSRKQPCMVVSPN